MQRQDSSLFDDALVESPASSEPTSRSLSAVVNKPREVAFPTQAAPTNIPKRIQYNLPNQTERTFERHDVLKPVEELLLRFDPWQDPTSYSDRNRAFALCGGGGLGKSVSAAHFVYKHISRYDNILWISAENTNKLFFAYSEIAFKLGLADDSKPHDKFACQKEVRNWLMGLYGSKRSQNDRVQWLLVFDNVTSPEDLDGFWPSRGGGDILITTQCRQEVINRFVRVYGTEVQPFGKDVALAFLNTLTKDQIEDPGQLAHAMQIAETLGGSPLALVSLFTLLKKKRLDNELVLKVTRRRESTDSAQSRPDLSGESLDQLALLVDPLLEKLDLSSSLMDVICLLDTDRIEDSILTRAAASMPLQGFPSDHLAYEAAKKELLDASLISQIGGGNGSGHGVAAHRMIRKVVQHRMSLERLQEVFGATVQMLSELWPEMTMTARHNTGRWGEIDVLLRQVRPLQHLYESITELVLPMRASILWATLLNNAAW
jgi:NB-ARC domain